MTSEVKLNQLCKIQSSKIIEKSKAQQLELTSLAENLKLWEEQCTSLKESLNKESFAINAQRYNLSSAVHSKIQSDFKESMKSIHNSLLRSNSINHLNEAKQIYEKISKLEITNAVEAKIFSQAKAEFMNKLKSINTTLINQVREEIAAYNRQIDNLDLNSSAETNKTSNSDVKINTNGSLIAVKRYDIELSHEDVSSLTKEMNSKLMEFIIHLYNEKYTNTFTTFKNENTQLKHNDKNISILVDENSKFILVINYENKTLLVWDYSQNQSHNNEHFQNVLKPYVEDINSFNLSTRSVALEDQQRNLKIIRLLHGSVNGEDSEKILESESSLENFKQLLLESLAKLSSYNSKYVCFDELL